MTGEGKPRPALSRSRGGDIAGKLPDAHRRYAPAAAAETTLVERQHTEARCEERSDRCPEATQAAQP
jgi:hypothetical protein